MALRLKNAPRGLVLLSAAAVWLSDATPTMAQYLPHERVADSVASRFTTTVPLKQCEYPRLWSNREDPSLQAQPVRGSLTDKGPVTDAVSPAILAETSPNPKTAGLFDTLTSHYKSQGFTIPKSLVVLESTKANAFVRHHDQVVITSALVEKVTDPSELAFILAHEMAHIALNHDTHGGVPAEVAADTLALKIVKDLNFNPCSGSNVLERLGSPANVTLVSVTPRLDSLHDKTEETCG